MPQTSVIFSPSIPDREIDQQVDKVNQSLDSAGQMSLDVDDSQLQDIGPDGGFGGIGGSGGMGGMGGVGTGAAAGGMASKLPSAVGGVAMSSVLPVALGGAIGVGLLSKMEDASGHLQATASMFGIATDMFFRPFGRFLGEKLRPMAQDWIDFTSRFNEISSSEGLMVGIGWVAENALKGIGSAIGDILTGQGNLGDFITVGVTGLTAAKLAGLLPSIGIGSLLTGMGGGTLSGLLGSVSLGSVVNPLTGSLLLLLGGAISLGDLIDGDISSWNFPARFGHAIGQAVRENWPDAADLVHDVFTKNPAYDFGQWIREGFEADPPDREMATDNARDWWEENRTTPGQNNDIIPPGGGVDVSNDYLDVVTGGPSGGTGGGVPAFNDYLDNLRAGNIPALQSGGMVENTGPAVVHEGEAVLPRSLVESLGGDDSTDTQAVESKLDEVNRNLKRLGRAMQDLGIHVDGEQFGRLAATSQSDRVLDSDPAV